MTRALVVLLAACTPSAASTQAARPAPAASHLYTLADVIGGWRWIVRTDEQGTSRVEDERWRLRPDPAAPLQLVGRYIRTVDVRSSDGVPFQCNQRPSYRQRAVFDVRVEPDRDGFRVRETAYATEPSPCDHGFRKLGEYHVEPHGSRMILRWAGGMQTLWQVDDAVTDLPATPWPETYDPAGPWRWSATSYDNDDNVRDESEWWQITRRTDTRLDATYRRRVTVRSVDGKPIACAGAPTWSFDDAYVLEGWREEEHWHFRERAVEPGDHPCLRTTPKRNLDEATGEQIGDYLVLEWRGKRREILYRPEPTPAPR